jgi:hypothetical protein
VCHLGDPGSNLGQISLVIIGFVQYFGFVAYSTPFHALVSRLGGETPSWIRAWSLIRNQKILLFSFRDTAMGLRSQRPLHVQGDAGHPS